MRLLSISSAVVALILGGCISTITGKPGASDDGITYSLPQTYLLVSPAADGTVSYQWLYLPDERRQYTITSNTFLAKYTLDVQLENGLLKQAGGQQDSTAVSSQFLKSLASIASAGAKSGSTSSGGGKSASAKGSGGGGGGDHSGDSGQSDSGSSDSGSQSGGSHTKTGGGSTDASKQPATKAANDTSGSKGPTIVPGRVAAAFGPVLFRIDIDETNGATFVPVKFPSVITQVSGGKLIANPAGPQVLFESNELVHTVSFGPVQVASTFITTHSDYPVASVSNIQIADSKTKKSAGVTATSKVADSAVDSGSDVAVQTDKALPPGDYTLAFDYLEKSGSKPANVSLPFHVPKGG